MFTLIATHICVCVCLIYMITEWNTVFDDESWKRFSDISNKDPVAKVYLNNKIIPK